MFKTTSIIVLLSCTILVMPCFGDDLFPNGFHNGGIGACDGCHSKIKYASKSGSVKEGAQESDTSGAVGAVTHDANRGMFNGEDPGSTCLICHMAPKGQKQPTGYFVATNNEDLTSKLPPAQMTPGGDFGWLKRTYRWSTRETSTLKDGLSPGDRHGHNIVASQFTYAPDFTNITAPGGDYPSDTFTCTSCHDPHATYRRLSDGSISTDKAIPIIASGSYKNSPTPNANHAVGSYRLLAGKGYSPKISGNPVNRIVFKADPPVAIAPDKYNRVEAGQSDTRVAYGSDMSEWCQNCHKAHSHPTGNSAKVSPAVAKHYNSYVSSGDMSGTKLKAYSSLVPFEIGTNDYSELQKVAGNGGEGADLSGPKPTQNIMCLTCHRAHATAWDGMTRWNTKTEFIVYNGKYPGIDNNTPPHIAQGRTSVDTSKASIARLTHSHYSNVGYAASVTPRTDAALPIRSRLFKPQERKVFI